MRTQTAIIRLCVLTIFLVLPSAALLRRRDDQDLPGDDAVAAHVVGGAQALDGSVVAAGDLPERIALAHAVGRQARAAARGAASRHARGRTAVVIILPV